MEIFKNKFLVKLIASICLMLTLLNFGATSKVYAEDEVWGGVLIKPIINLLTGLGDAIMDILHDAALGQKVTMMKINGDTEWWHFWKTFALVIVSILAAVVFVIAVAATSGLATAALGVLAGGTFTFSMGTVSAGLLLGGAAVGVCVGIRAGNAWFPDDIYLPVFTISAEEIFKNDLALFDVNFFEPGNFTRHGTEQRTITWEQKEIFSEKIETTRANTNDYPAWIKFYEIISGGQSISNFPNLYINDETNGEFQSESELNSFNWSKYNSTMYDMYDSKSHAAMMYILEKINYAQREDKLTTIEQIGINSYSLMAKAYTVEDDLRQSSWSI